MSILRSDINPSPGYDLGRSLADGAVGPAIGYGVNLMSSPLPVRLMHGAALGGLSAMGANAVSSMFRRRGAPFKWWQAALLGAGLGAAGTAGAGNMFQQGQQRQADLRTVGMSKRAFFDPGSSARDGDNLMYVLGKLNSDPEVPAQAKMQIIDLVETLPSDDLSELARLLRTSLGASAGFLIAKYLLGANVGGAVLAALLGGMMSQPGPTQNAFGQTFF